MEASFSQSEEVFSRSHITIGFDDLLLVILANQLYLNLGGTKIMTIPNENVRSSAECKSVIGLLLF